MNNDTPTGGIFYCRDSAGFSVSASNKLSCNLTGQCFGIGNKNIPPTVTVHCKKTETDDRMTKEFLLHKDKKKEIPPHIQAHLALPDPKANASQNQKSLHFSDPPADNKLLKNNLKNI